MRPKRFEPILSTIAFIGVMLGLISGMGIVLWVLLSICTGGLP